MRRASVILCLLAAGCGVGPRFASARGAQTVLRAFGLDPLPGADFRIESENRWGDWAAGGAGHSIILAARGSERLRIEADRGLERGAADKLMAQRVSRVLILYSGGMPYPGAITQRFEVPKDLRPESIEPPPLGFKTLLLNATPRLTYGAGSDDLIAYRALLTFRYCPNEKTLAQIELFFPKSRFARALSIESLALFRCSSFSP